LVQTTKIHGKQGTQARTKTSEKERNTSTLTPSFTGLFKDFKTCFHENIFRRQKCTWYNKSFKNFFFSLELHHRCFCPLAAVVSFINILRARFSYKSAFFADNLLPKPKRN